MKDELTIDDVCRVMAAAKESGHKIKSLAFFHREVELKEYIIDGVENISVVKPFVQIEFFGPEEC